MRMAHELLRSALPILRRKALFSVGEVYDEVERLIDEIEDYLAKITAAAEFEEDS
jgi:hypothetical protein